MQNSSSPPAFINKLVYRSEVHSKNTRCKSKLTMPQHRTAMFQRSVLYQAIRLLNILPGEFRAYNINKFKYKLKQLLLSEQV